VGHFVHTAAEVIFRPTHFFRSTTSRGDMVAARAFARINWLLTSIMLGLAAWIHWHVYLRVILRAPREPMWMDLLVLVGLLVGTYVLTVGILRLATALTVWEAGYRGYRLPGPVVLRALYYHAAHSLPVGVVVLLTVAGHDYFQSIGYFQMTSLPGYLYVLSGEVFIAANYLFFTYWIAMKNLMYANR
jgi:hypothetical protein